MSNFGPQTMDLVRAVGHEAERLLRQRRVGSGSPRQRPVKSDERVPATEVSQRTQVQREPITDTAVAVGRRSEAPRHATVGQPHGDNDMMSTTRRQTLGVSATLVDQAGAKIGKAGQLYLDDQTGQPSWVTVKTDMFGSSESFVPLGQATVEGGDTIRVPYTKDQIRDAPRVDAGQQLSSQEEQDLYRYYGLSYSDVGAASAVRSEEVPVEPVQMDSEAVPDSQQVAE